MDAPEPNWSLLPGDPVGFFELASEYDRKDLKRAYTRLIRYFKPERHPDEFQRIREAYDRLDEGLRYLVSTGPRTLAFPSTPASSTFEEPETIERVDALALFREIGATATRDALRNEPDLDGANWCHLALLEDTLGSEPLTLCRTLMEAVRATGGEAEPVNLLRGALLEDFTAKQQAQLVSDLLPLVTGANAPFRADLYWFLSEALWLEMVTSVKFSGFAELLECCSAKVGEEGWSGRLVLLLCLIRKAAFRADDEWFAAACRELGESYQQLTHWQQEELDLADWLLAYRAERAEFVEVHEFREVLDDALVAIVEGDEVQADRQFLAAQVACLDQREELLEAFPPEGQDGIGPYLLEWYAVEASNRRLDEEPPPTEEWMDIQSNAFARRMLRRTRWKFMSVARRWARRTMITFFVGVFALPWLLLYFLDDFTFLLWAASVVDLALFAVAFRKGFFGDFDRKMQMPFIRKLYDSHWRDATADFLAETHVPVDHVAAILEALSEDVSGLDYVPELVVQDSGLRLYSVALRFAQ